MFLDRLNEKLKTKFKKKFITAFSTKPIKIVVWYTILRSRNEISRERQEKRERERRERENRRKEKERAQINKSRTFKSDECVICLTNPPEILFCNCGHLCLCIECDETKGLDVCPV